MATPSDDCIRYCFKWVNPSIEVMIRTPFETGKIVTGNLHFTVHGKSILRLPSHPNQLMYGARSLFVALLVIVERHERVELLPAATRDVWNVATSQAEISTDCLDGRALRVVCSGEVATICWRNAPNWDGDVNSDEFEMVKIDKSALSDACKCTVRYLNQFFSNCFDCEQLKYVQK